MSSSWFFIKILLHGIKVPRGDIYDNNEGVAAQRGRFKVMFTKRLWMINELSSLVEGESFVDP